jgi:hypothetical protein
MLDSWEIGWSNHSFESMNSLDKLDTDGLLVMENFGDDNCDDDIGVSIDNIHDSTSDMHDNVVSKPVYKGSDSSPMSTISKETKEKPQ